MAMARGLGAFAEGFTQGYAQMSEIDARRQAVEREKQRMALEERRADLEQQRFGMEKENFELGKQRTGMEIAALKKEEDFQNDLKQSLARVQQMSMPGYEGEVIDSRTGKSQGVKRFQNPDEEIGPMKERGLAFRAGSIKQVGPMDPLDYQMKFADEFMAVQARHGKLTPEMLDAAKARRKQIEGEGAIEAARYFMTTGDEAGAKAMFAKQGKITLGKDITLSVVRDPITGPKIIGTRGGKQVFDMFDDVILPSMSAESYAKTQAEMKKLGIQEAGEDRRAGQAAKAAMDRTVYEANARMVAANKDKGDEMSKELYKYTLEFAGKFASNPTFTWDPAQYMRWASTVAAKAEQHRRGGLSIPEAAAKATNEVPVPEAVVGKAKK